MVNNLCDYNRECIDTLKVFDYVIVNRSGTISNIPFTPSNGVTTTEICDLITAGNQFSNVRVGNIIASCSEIEPREDQEVELENGESITLQWVTLTNGPITLTITFDIVNDLGQKIDTFCGTISGPANSLPPEQILLCAPEGTEISCEWLPSTIKAFNVQCIPQGQNPPLITLSLTGTLCLAIQSYDEVKLEIFAKQCQPRELINPTTTCAPQAPQQCPQIFPGHL
ncbi:MULTISPECIES: hypothetical protein [Pontibacillus]|uniref:Uncharacterized protein n=1 Tax=Pontibacillus chungwhensis TaxID=265426 RepID=A0ABY8UZ80_9BACI|nr:MULTISPECIES: hypothetical protein [Pontibacillus]MCD5325536.1 hypothetical protein [Pontibacillus sp. HN14]WIF98645.1 hypothetical protein QNI29_02965 [Pontibacillus chungwhensis]